MTETLIIVCLVLATGCVLIGAQYILLRRKYKAMATDLGKLAYEMNVMSSDYSDKVLKYVREFTAQLTVFMFNEFIDGHDVSKINKAQIQNLISEISHKAYQSMNLDLIMFDRLLFTKEYLETFIINTIISDIKTLWDKTLMTE